MTKIAVLFARHDSNYKSNTLCDVWDIDRDARNFQGGMPVIAHPPCRAWGRLRGMANPRPDEKNLARLAVALVREFGGIVEHPAGSSLWASQKMPKPGSGFDSFGGWTLEIKQRDFGHRADKMTWLYIVGCEAGNPPNMPLPATGEATHVITQGLLKGHPKWRPRVTDAEREHTPAALADWLVQCASRCAV